MTATYPAAAEAPLPERRKNNTTYMTASAAARQAGVVQTTITNWTSRYPDLGKKVAGRWRINPAQLERILDGQQPLRNSR